MITEQLFAAVLILETFLSYRDDSVCVPHNFGSRAKRAFPVWQNNVGLTPSPSPSPPTAALWPPRQLQKKGEQVLDGRSRPRGTLSLSDLLVMLSCLFLRDRRRCS